VTIDTLDEFEGETVFMSDSMPNELLTETFNCAVLDTACPSTVAGEAWLKVYLDSLNSQLRDKVTQKKSKRLFKFGDGVAKHSLGQYRIPVFVVGKLVMVTTDIVKDEVPLLLSRKAMKDLGMVIDLQNDTAKLFDQTITLEVTASGHYYIPLWNTEVTEVCAVFQNMTLEPKQLLHPHRQFGHPSYKKFTNLLKDAGVWESRLEEGVDKIYDTCKICKMFKRTPSRPIVGLPLAKSFNDYVTLDLKQWDQQYILHIIDAATRYTLSVLIRNKQPSTIVEAILMNWIGVFGVMKNIHSDNGGEFNNDEMREVASLLNVRLHTTAAESPWQNGLNERNHYITDTILRKLQNDFPKHRVEVLLKWANMARNSLQMNQGYSSHTLVFGLNPNLPNVMYDTPSSMETTTTSDKLLEHLDALKAARGAFIEAENSERIRRALRSRIRASEGMFSPGEEVYYKRENDKWLGPAKVMFQDGKVVFLRHGGAFIRVAPHRVIKVQSEVENVQSENSTISGEAHEMNRESEKGVTSASNAENELSNQQADQRHSSSTADSQASVAGLRRSERSRDRRNYADLHSRGNVMAVIVPQSEHDSAECTIAKQVELNKLRDFDTYEPVQDNGQDSISTRWIITRNSEGVKARLVARGFEDSDIVQSDSPTAGKSSVRILLAIAASKGWDLGSTDITSAYLQGDQMSRVVHLLPPREANEQGHLWKLKKCLYGLNDGARKFYDSMCAEMAKLECKKSLLDPSLFFTLNSDGGLEGLMVSHIDDFLHTDTSSFDDRPA
jgi:transposase InsO family protein